MTWNKLLRLQVVGLRCDFKLTYERELALGQLLYVEVEWGRKKKFFNWQTSAWSMGWCRARLVAHNCCRCGCTVLPVAVQDPWWQTEQRLRFPSSPRRQFPTNATPKSWLNQLENGMWNNLFLLSGGSCYLEFFHTGHVVAEHSVLQQGDGVALTAHFLDLLTCAVAVRAKIGAGVLCKRALEHYRVA